MSDHDDMVGMPVASAWAAALATASGMANPVHRVAAHAGVTALAVPEEAGL